MRMKCTVSYDGSNYIGWQVQNGTNNIQYQIEQALGKMHKHPINICGSGRTDAGVHAYAQVFHFDTNLVITKDRWLHALNCNSPKDIYFIDIINVSDYFHARYHVLEKTYEYRFNIDAYNVLRVKYCAQIKYPLDIEKMQEASKVFIGEHDFTSFCANTLKASPNQVRTINSIDFHQDNHEWVITYKGNGFMRYMVRMLTASLFEVGYNRIDKEELVKWLEAKDKTVCRLNAPACGLYLKEVKYDNIYY